MRCLARLSVEQVALAIQVFESRFSVRKYGTSEVVAHVIVAADGRLSAGDSTGTV